MHDAFVLSSSPARPQSWTPGTKVGLCLANSQWRQGWGLLISGFTSSQLSLGVLRVQYTQRQKAHHQKRGSQKFGLTPRRTNRQ